MTAVVVVTFPGQTTSLPMAFWNLIAGIGINELFDSGLLPRLPRPVARPFLPATA